jgi:retron-type reverse transcriptase
MLTEERRTDGWRDIRTDAAYGVDEVSAQAYEQDVDANISHLVERRQRKRDRATRVRRHSMPKENGQLRPLGRPAVEDKRLQMAVTRLRTALDAQEFLRGREGDRPDMGALDAVDTRTLTRPCGRDHWGGEADMQGVFDHAC